MIKAGSMTMKMEFPKALYGLAPALISAPAFASVDVSELCNTYYSELFRSNQLYTTIIFTGDNYYHAPFP
jgi:hypothetical protein